MPEALCSPPMASRELHRPLSSNRSKVNLENVGVAISKRGGFHGKCFTPLYLATAQRASHRVRAPNLARWHDKIFELPRRAAQQRFPQTMSGAAGIFELIGGVLIVLGLFTRPVAFILSGLYAVAYFYAHFPRGFFPLLNAGSLAILLCFVFLYLAAAGGGTWSVDRIWRKTKD